MIGLQNTKTDLNGDKALFIARIAAKESLSLMLSVLVCFLHRNTNKSLTKEVGNKI